MTKNRHLVVRPTADASRRRQVGSGRRGVSTAWLGGRSAVLILLAPSLFSSGRAAELYPPLTRLWAFAAQGGFYAPPLLRDERMYVGSVNGAVYALDSDGRELWKTTLGGQVYAGLAADGERLYAASTQKLAAALDPTDGRVLWRHTLGGVVYATPAVEGGVVVIGTGDTGVVYGLDPATGDERWRLPLGDRMGSGLAAADGMLYLPSYDSHLYAAEASSGLLRWQFVAAGPIDSAPLVDGDRLYLKLADDRVYALNRSDGKLLWSTPGSGRALTSKPSNWSPLRMAAGRLVFGSLDGRLHALDPADGKPVWASAAGGERPSPPTPAGEFGYAGGKDGSLEAIDLDDGQSVWAWRPDQAVKSGLLSGIMWPPVADGTRLYASSLDGHLYAFEGVADRSAWAEANAIRLPDRPVGEGWPANLPLLCGPGLAPTDAEIEAVRELGRRVRGFVVWESNRDGGTDLYRLGTDGGGFRRLTRFGERRTAMSWDGDLRPQISPSGREILFCYGRREGPPEAWLVSADGVAPRKLADGRPLSWSPDGSGCYLLRERRLLRWERATGEVAEVGAGTLPFDGSEPGLVGAVSPDGRGVCLGDGRTVQYFSLGLGRAVFSQAGSSPRLTTDGWYVYWLTDGELQLAELRTGVPRAIDLRAAGPVDTVHVSPDQRWLAYSANGTLSLQELDAWRLVGGPVRLSWHAAADRCPAIWVAP